MLDADGNGVPYPWEPSLLHAAFAFRKSAVLQTLFSRQREALRSRLSALGDNRTVASLFKVLRADGMRSSTLGLDFSRLQQRRYADAPSRILADEEVLRALELLVFPVDTSLEGSAVLARTLWQRDQPPRSRSRDEPRPSESLRKLRADGFLRVAEWRRWGALDMHALAAQVGVAMEAEPAASKKKCCRSSRAPLPALGPLLNSTRLARLMRAYLGGPVRYDDHIILELTEHAKTENYVSSLWHHDRCGRRLKLFVFLHDVDVGTRPTLIAARSHNTLYYTHNLPWRLLSRYSDGWVRQQHRVEQMVGPGGGGFLFDTNALHKGEVDGGNRSRLAVILEFHRHGKLGPLLQRDNPCPSIKAAPRAVRASAPGRWERGVPELPLYPAEQLRL